VWICSRGYVADVSGKGHNRTSTARSLRVLAIALACFAAALIGLVVFAQAQVGVASCRFATAEKLGVPFYRVCPSASAATPFWISAPLTCGAGEHDTVQCPDATALVDVEGSKAHTFASRSMAMVDAFTAHRLCGMRFGGQLPSPAQRASARELLGLASLLVTQGPNTSDAIRLSELPEWVAKGNCANPSILGSECLIETFPRASVQLPIAWTAVRACSAVAVTSLPPDRIASELGGDCPGGPSDCLVASPGASAGAYTLSCVPSARASHAPERSEALAAVRCSVADSTFGQRNSPAD
jgi:hypothetical protein